MRLLSPNYNLRPSSERWIWELSDTFLMAVSRLDLELEFRGALGDRYTKTVFCIPRRVEREITQRLSEGGSRELRRHPVA